MAAGGNGWISSVAFREFRKEHTALSRLYWTFRFTQAAAEGPCDAALGDLRSLPEALGLEQKIKPSMFPVRASDLASTITSAENTLMLLLIVMCCANLEEYLKLAAEVHVLAQGHHETGTAATLTPVGQAVLAPIARSSTVPDMVKYAEALFDQRLGVELETLRRAYRVRCAMAHSGGIATPKVVKAVPTLKLKVGAPITLDWPFLFETLKATDDVCSKIDQAAMSKLARSFEARRIALERLRETKPTTMDSARKRIATEYNIRVTKSDIRVVFSELGWPAK